MKRYGHGLVLGRFHPPHAGHHHLVDTARDRCERLTVLVRASSVDSLPPADRVAWMREIHPDVLVVGAVDDITVDLQGPDVRASRMAVLRAAVPERVDVVFTSDARGEELGRRFDADVVYVDPDRTRFPVSGTAVREDPAACWEYLKPPVRAALTRRVVVLGAESSGTTTLALALTEHYRGRGGVWADTRYVPEYGRAYGELRLAELRARRPGATWRDVTLRSGDFPVIAQRQAELEEEAARAGSPVLICDTDAFATTIRHERYLGTASPATGAVAARGRQHLWLLTDHRGVAFEDDGPPDGEHLRPWMTARLLARLSLTGRRTAVLTGPHEERLATAVAAVDALLVEGSHLAAPLPGRR
ncbi:AAA family ATPase [Streptomyces sp. NBC_01216]|uniref:AAA family ATPase n=1 Tax=unclassified Streptomyces TaxID=2593676 RepID=UPI002E127835|nr:AAA family ATPase [Streptomyces sp. NBC_01216]